MNFTHPDGIDESLLNHAIWYAGHAFATPYPGEPRVLLPSEIRPARVRVDEDGS
jgi:hypothetical protein